MAVTSSTTALHLALLAIDVAPGDPVSLACEKQTIALPLHNKMTDDDLEYIINSIKEIAECKYQNV